jgi:hypothetical protein
MKTFRFPAAFDATGSNMNSASPVAILPARANHPEAAALRDQSDSKTGAIMCEMREQLK